MSTWQAIGLAFLGGMLLNLMPCVLPVLGVKTAALASMGGHSFAKRLRHGLGYAAGIIASMLILAGVVIALEQAGRTVGWGFQFQQPLYVVVLAAMMVLFALNLFGVFQIGVPEATSRLGGKNLADDGRSFFEGVLAVVLATPCTAPFMGTAIGFAMTSSPVAIALTFVSLGIGLATPFVVIALVPQFRGLLPKPGPWMNVMKKVLGFALLLTAVWLIWLFGRLVGLDGVTGLIGFLLALSFATWLYGAVQYRTFDRIKAAALAAAGAAVVIGGWLGVSDVEPTPAPTAVAVAPGAEAQSAGGPDDGDAASVDESGETTESGPTQSSSDPEIEWHEWTPTIVERFTGEGRPVFVNFTADWCISCKANERNVIATNEVLEAANEADVAMVMADLTHTDERLVAQLEKFGRTGVPLYLLYEPDKPDEPKILPQILTENRMIEAFEQVR